MTYIIIPHKCKSCIAWNWFIAFFLILQNYFEAYKNSYKLEFSRSEKMYVIWIFMAEKWKKMNFTEEYVMYKKKQKFV